MGNPTRKDGRIESGQKLGTAISARAWNRAQDAADIVLGERARFGADGQSAIERPSNIILIRNDSGVDVPWLGVLNIGGPVISPIGGTLDGTNAASDRARQFVRQPVMTGITPNALFNFTRFAICMEPIASGSIGRAAVSGVFACLVRMTSGSHNYARPRPGDVTQLESAECGPVSLLWKPIQAGDLQWALGVL